MRPGRPLELAVEEWRGIGAVLYEPDESAGGSGVVLPGGSRAGHRLGGTPARPDLHYVRALLVELGLAVVELWWDAESAPDAGPDEARWLDAHAVAAVRAAAEVGPPRVLVGRSFGTCALARLVGRAEARAAVTVWIAPLLPRPDVRAALEEHAASAFVAAGSADEVFDVDSVDELRARGATVSVVAGANHGLDVGDAAESARALAAVVDELRSFLLHRLEPSK